MLNHCLSTQHVEHKPESRWDYHSHHIWKKRWIDELVKKLKRVRPSVGRLRRGREVHRDTLSFTKKQVISKKKQIQHQVTSISNMTVVDHTQPNTIFIEVCIRVLVLCLPSLSGSFCQHMQFLSQPLAHLSYRTVVTQVPSFIHDSNNPTPH